MDRINQSLERVTGHARELLLIIKKEIEDATKAFATGKPPGTDKVCNCGCKVTSDEIPCDASHCVLKEE